MCKGGDGDGNGEVTSDTTKYGLKEEKNISDKTSLVIGYNLKSILCVIKTIKIIL